ncbi:MAG: EAL domain-containing protein [Lachnospiraceae bacterium]|nr:EAL domain-containing protein [Lachnospiraceae bacterium]
MMDDSVKADEEKRKTTQEAINELWDTMYTNDEGIAKVDRFLQHKDPEQPCGLLVIDVDQLQEINISYGRDIGDEVVLEVGRLLCRSFRKNDILIKAGGDSYVVFLKGMPHSALVKKTSDLLHSIREIRVSLEEVSVTCSIGVCYLPEGAEGFNYMQLLANADWALHHAKQHGRNRYEFCDDINRSRSGAAQYSAPVPEQNFAPQRFSQSAEKPIPEFRYREGVTLPDFDSLTGLISFTRFRDEVDQVLSAPDRGSWVMVYSDFLHFKYLNQHYGYDVGDFLLRNFASFVIDTMRSPDRVHFARVISDQFVLFMPCTDRQEAPGRVDTINRKFISAYHSHFPDANLRIRSGLYFIEEDCTGASAAIDAANSARLHVTDETESSVCVYGPSIRQEIEMENQVLNNMNQAMKDGEFKVYLQPKFSLDDYSITGAEALVRWQKPDGTIIPPDSFVPICERTGRIVELDFYVFEKVAEFLAKNNELGRRQVSISINASAVHATEQDTVERYLEILKKYNVDPSLTEIELTETAAVSDFDNVVSLFNRLKAVGMPISLDDFGAGYSVLNSIVDIPVDTIKVDRLFIVHCEKSEKGLYLLRHIIAMMNDMGYHVICEGVETEEQIRILKDAGCHEGQGYWFSKPVPIEKYEELMYGAAV